MPRLSRALLNQARGESYYLPFLLPACRTLEAARDELRWIRKELPSYKWAKACYSRSRLIPLQYILGTQPFGDLTIKCRKNVLIPRAETEEWALKLAKILSHKVGVPLSLLDLCTGSGCIPLLLAYVAPNISNVVGVDLSRDAIKLSNFNKELNNIKRVSFQQGDVLLADVTNTLPSPQFDLITANPPYILESEFLSSETERSVKLHEPKLALLGDLEFYESLVKNIVLKVGAQGFVFEVGNEKQIEYTSYLLTKLDSTWTCGTYYDFARKPRCVIGWVKNSTLSVLSGLCN